MSLFNAADQLDAEAEGNVDDWSELKSRRPATWSDSLYEFLGLQEKDDVPKPKADARGARARDGARQARVEALGQLRHPRVLAPSLISEEEFDAAVKIGNLIRNFNARARARGGASAASRWSHSKKILVPCTIRIDGSREYLVLSQNRFKSKQRRLKDIHTITRGYNSPFLRDLLQHKSPEKVLSLLLRNRAKGGKEESIDLMFELPGSGAKAGADASLASDGKFLRNKFFANFTKLQHELESDDAFFFNTDGVYCQVGRSVFDRWEQVTLIDPNWDKEIDEDERRVRLKRKYNERSKEAAKRRKFKENEPIPAPLEQLKPYFEKELKEVYGDIGGTKDQKTTGRKLVAAFNPELDKRRGSKGGDDDDAPRDKGTVDEAKLGKLKVAVLNGASVHLERAYQNEILRVGDYIVGVNGVYPKKIDALIQGTEKSQKRRVLNILRPKSAAGRHVGLPVDRQAQRLVFVRDGVEHEARLGADDEAVVGVASRVHDPEAEVEKARNKGKAPAPSPANRQRAQTRKAAPAIDPALLKAAEARRGATGDAPPRETVAPKVAPKTLDPALLEAAEAAAEAASDDPPPEETPAGS
ncbi:hypothetical protein JL720_16431 [Aureococcus anophagefferens]|nr:hypothetical protein JL720_16431 [Aureococcus anophagefferens]